MCMYYCHRVAIQLQFNKCIIYQFIDCMLYYINTSPHITAPFFGLVSTPAASIHQYHKHNRLVEQDITVIRDEMLIENYFDVVFKLPCNTRCSFIWLWFVWKKKVSKSAVKLWFRNYFWDGGRHCVMPVLLLLVYWAIEKVYTFDEYRRVVPSSELYRIGFVWLRVGMMGRWVMKLRIL